MKRTPLRSRPLIDRSAEPGYREWKAPVWGHCAVCGTRGLLLRHHVITERHVRLAGGDPWDQRNALLVGYWSCACHRAHHHAVRRIPLSKIPSEAREFAAELYGERQGAAQLRRYYARG